MTDQFDEGVKEILLSLLSIGATAYETDYLVDVLRDRPEPIEQKVDALKQAEEIIVSPSFDKAAEGALERLEDTPPERKAKRSIPKDVEATPPSTEQSIHSKLVRGGLTPIAAAGVVANLWAESKLDPAAKQYKGGPGRGVAQWEKKGRFDTDRINLVGFAEKRGTDWTDLDTQIAFILHELDVHPEYRRVKKLLNSAESVDEATTIFLKKYEKAGIEHADKRLAYGREFYDKYIK